MLHQIMSTFQGRHRFLIFMRSIETDAFIGMVTRSGGLSIEELLTSCMYSVLMVTLRLVAKYSLYKES